MGARKQTKRLAAKVRNEITAIVGTGCSLATAAKYTGCAISAIRREIKTDAEFRAEIAKAEELAEIYFLRQIKKAAQKEQYWRAAAWVLERRHPARYAARSAGTLTAGEIRDIFEKLADIVLAEVKDKENRQKIIRRVEKLLSDISTGKAVAPENVRTKPAALGEDGEDLSETGEESPDAGSF